MGSLRHDTCARAYTHRIYVLYLSSLASRKNKGRSSFQKKPNMDCAIVCMQTFCILFILLQLFVSGEFLFSFCSILHRSSSMMCGVLCSTYYGNDDDKDNNVTIVARKKNVTGDNRTMYHTYMNVVGLCTRSTWMIAQNSRERERPKKSLLCVCAIATTIRIRNHITESGNDKNQEVTSYVTIF